MSLKMVIIKLQDRLELAMKNYRYKSANKDRDAKVKERMEYMDCAGKLNQSLALFKSTIYKQALHIQEGEFYGRDTKVQEDELWAAALGYMLVQEAQYHLKSVYNLDTIGYAYDLLKGVEKYLDGGRISFPKVLGVTKSKERTKAGFIIPERVIRDKSELLGSFFEDLKQTGDIEGCLKEARMKRLQARKGMVSPGTSGGGGTLMDRRKELDKQPVEEEELILDDDYLSAAVPEDDMYDDQYEDLEEAELTMEDEYLDEEVEEVDETSDEEAAAEDQEAEA